MSEIEAVEVLEGWVAEDRDLADDARRSSATAGDQALAIRYFSGLPNTAPAEASRMLAQADQLEEEGKADEAEAKAWDAAADGWQTIIDEINEGVDDPDRH